ncbi:MAG: DUF4338 domain-containing protein [Desulfobacterales bacterium]
MNQLPAFKTFCGNRVTQSQIDEIKEIISLFPSLSRAELANTICELFSWKRPTGKLKTVEALQYLKVLEDWSIIKLPNARATKKKGTSQTIRKTERAEEQDVLDLPLKEISPVYLEKIINKKQRDLFYDYVDRYHYLGYQRPFGAHLRYFIKAAGINDAIVGCLQFSSPAWRMTPRDQYIGWNEDQRVKNLQKVINNSRFLILPWVRVKNLASRVLALASKVIPLDWEKTYAYQPVLLETLIDSAYNYTGTCYKAANWIHVGTTTGRGRMDRKNERHGTAPKEIFLYPLCSDFRKKLLA